MMYKIFCIRDVHTGFLSPTVDQNDPSAVRNFHYAVNRVESLMGSSPKDYDLYEIGSFDSETGEIIPTTPPRFVVSAVSVKDGEE